MTGRITCRALIGLAIGLGLGSAAADPGRTVYDFHCYQCHGYAGDARTAAASKLLPRPRDFLSSDPDELGRHRMLNAVERGRPGTAMAAYQSILTPAEIKAVVDFVRENLMAGRGRDRSFHTTENGWPDHDRYAAAFPFATGEIPIDVEPSAMSAPVREGRRLFLRSCTTCHDGQSTTSEPVWSARPVSYPRSGYGQQTRLDVQTGASPYAIHDVAPSTPNLSKGAARGRDVYTSNCAFCHAADGSGKNWIGSFLQPRPRDLRGLVETRRPEILAERIRTGVAGTSMPAWRLVLADDQILDVVAYIAEALTRAPEETEIGPVRPPASLVWRRGPG